MAYVIFSGSIHDLSQVSATFRESGPDPSKIFFKLAKGTKKILFLDLQV